LNKSLPFELRREDVCKKYGVVVRTEKGKLDADIALKLRIANGTHTAVAHVMALKGLLLTDELSKDTENAQILMAYLDSFFQEQILKGVECTSSFTGDAKEAKLVWEDWRKRLIHPYFGLSTFFITQNGAAKGGIRIGPTIKDLLINGKVCLKTIRII
jgi:mannitol-1-phosphate/altronate dehydrogenase